MPKGESRSRHTGRSSDQVSAHVRENLPAYATAAALGRPLENEDPTVVAHLRGCAACRDELDELTELMQAAYRDEVVDPGAAPDLRFLRRRAPEHVLAERGWHVDDRRQISAHFPAALLLQARPASLAGSARGMVDMTHAITPEDLPHFRGVIAVEGGDEDTCVIRVTVEFRDREVIEQPPVEVLLRALNDERRVTTNEIGEAVIHGLPRAALPHVELTLRLPDDT